MKPFMIAMATAASLVGAALLGAEANAAPQFGGPGGFKAGAMKPLDQIKFKPGGKHGAIKPGKGWKPPHKHGHHGHWRGRHWGHGYGWGAYFASPIYVGTYAACDWVRIKTRHGWRWRPYC